MTSIGLAGPSSDRGVHDQRPDTYCKCQDANQCTLSAHDLDENHRDPDRRSTDTWPASAEVIEALGTRPGLQADLRQHQNGSNLPGPEVGSYQKQGREWPDPCGGGRYRLHFSGHIRPQLSKSRRERPRPGQVDEERSVP